MYANKGWKPPTSKKELFVGKVYYREEGGVEEWLTCVSKKRKGGMCQYLLLSVDFHFIHINEGDITLDKLQDEEEEPSVLMEA